MAAQSKVIHNGSRHNRKGFGTEPLGGTEFLKSTENNRRIVCDAIPGRAEVSMGRGDDPGSSQQEKQRLTPVALTILSNPIRQIDGLYSLNDLHKASGGENKHRPNYFLSNEQTKALIDEIQIAGIPAISAKPRRGTYACRELVIAYAAWISAAFHLKVIRVFLGKEVSPQPVSNPDKFITPEQQGILFNLMAIRFPEGRDRPYGWSRFQRHFVVNSYKNLPADKFAQACCYIPAMPDREVKALPAPDLSTLIPRLEWTQPDPIGRRDSVRNYVATEKLIMELKAWADSLPRDIGSPLRAALNDLNNLLVTGWTEVDEALSCINQGMNYLHRWQGRNGRIGNVG